MKRPFYVLFRGVGGRDGGIVVMWVHDQQVQCMFQVNISAAAEFDPDGTFCLWVVVITLCELHRDGRDVLQLSTSCSCVHITRCTLLFSFAMSVVVLHEIMPGL